MTTVRTKNVLQRMQISYATVDILIILDHGFIRISNLVVTLFFNRNIPYFFQLFIYPAKYNSKVIHAFYKNNFIKTTRLKFAQIFRISKEQLRLGFRCKCNCRFLLKNTTRCCMRVTIISCAKLCVVVHF